MITNLLRMCTTVAPRAIIVVRPHFETGMLTILPLRLDLRLGAAGIINRRGRDLSPGATVMLAESREAATRLSRNAAKAR